MANRASVLHQSEPPFGKQRSALVVDNLFESLKASCRDDWQAYVTHPFVEQLGTGSLPLDCFKHYLGQDYIFLMHFARAYALAVFKSEHLDDMRQAAGTLGALLNSEMSLHLTFCARWGLDEDALMPNLNSEWPVGWGSEVPSP